jgi:hypothetical protein
MVFRPSPRDIKWIELYQQHKGKINADFGVLAFTTPPLAAFPSCDAKFTTSDMAKRLETWALFGPPLGRSWQPTDEEREKYPGLKPLVSNDWAILAPESKATTEVIARSASKGTPVAVDLGFRKRSRSDYDADPDPLGELPPAWHGTLLPKTDADIWLAAAFTEYERIVALELALKARAKDGKLSDDDKQRLEVAQWGFYSRWLTARTRHGGDVPLAATVADGKSNDWYEIAVGRGASWVFGNLHYLMGTEAFAKCMDEFGRQHAGKQVTTAQFREHVEKAWGKLEALFDQGLNDHFEAKDFWSTTSFEAEPDHVLIVYGTSKEVHAQREAAALLQEKLRRRTGNYSVPIKSDKEVTEADLKNKHLLLIGRPDSNAGLAACATSLPVKFGSGSFTVRVKLLVHSGRLVVAGDPNIRFEVQEKTYANPASAVIAAGTNPHNPRYSIVAFSGLSAEATRNSIDGLANRGGRLSPVILLAAGEAARPMVVQIRGTTAVDTKAAR